MRSTCPATASTRTVSAAISPSPAPRPRHAASGHRRRRAQAQRHPDRARKHPRRRDRAAGGRARRSRPMLDAHGRARQRRAARLQPCRLHHRVAAEPVHRHARVRVDDRQSLVRDFLANGYQVGVFSGQAEDFGDTADLVGMRRGPVSSSTARRSRTSAPSPSPRRARSISTARSSCASSTARLGQPRGLGAGRTSSISTCSPPISPIPIRAWTRILPGRADRARRDQCRQSRPCRANLFERDRL